MPIEGSLLLILLVFAFVGYIKLADDPFGRAKAERQRIKEESDRMLSEMDKNVAERKLRN